MDYEDYTTETPRRKGKHLTAIDRGVIKSMYKEHSYREIADVLNCSPSTVSNEIKRGTPPRKSNKGKAPGYSPEYGQRCYEENRSRSRKQPVVFQRISTSHFYYFIKGTFLQKVSNLHLQFPK